MGGDGDTVLCGGTTPGFGLRATLVSVARYAFDLADWERSGWVVPHGVSGDPASPHYTDQLLAWAELRLLPMRYDWAGIERAARARVALDAAARMMRLARAFFARPCLEVAPEILGLLLIHELPGGARLVGRIVEVEAYLGEGSDAASHAHRGPTPRSRIMFGEPGHFYVYRSMGLHFCANVVCEPEGHAAAVLLRAAEPSRVSRACACCAEAARGASSRAALGSSRRRSRSSSGTTARDALRGALRLERERGARASRHLRGSAHRAQQGGRAALPVLRARQSARDACGAEWPCARVLARSSCWRAALTREYPASAVAEPETSEDALEPRVRFLRACRGELVDRPPVWLMRQAGRYLPEYRALREKSSFLAMCDSPDLATEISLQPHRRFGMDGVVVFSDILLPLRAGNLELAFAPGPTVANPLRSLADLERLRGDVARGHRADLRDTAPAAARARLARRADRLRRRALDAGRVRDRVASSRATSKCSRRSPGASPTRCCACSSAWREICAETLRLQIEAGADCVQIFDTWAGVLDRPRFEQFAGRALRDVLARLGRERPPVIVFARGAAHLLDELRRPRRRRRVARLAHGPGATRQRASGSASRCRATSIRRRCSRRSR